MAATIMTPPPPPACSSRQDLLFPVVDPVLHFKCAQFRSSTCCSNAVATQVVQSQLESLDAASTSTRCFELQ